MGGSAYSGHRDAARPEGMNRMAAALRYPADRVCIVLLTGLGDVVHGLPVVNALKRDDPRRHITWVVEPTPASILEHHDAVDEIVVFEKARGLKGVRNLWRELRGRSFDLTLNLNIYFKSIFPTLFSRAPHRLAVNRARARDAIWLAANHELPPRPRGHTQDLFFEFLEFLGVQDLAVEWRIPFTEEERLGQAHFFEPLRERPVVTIVPASANSRKDWFARRWAEVVTALERDFGFTVVLAGGPSRREANIVHEILERSEASPVDALGDSVRRLAWIIAGSQLVIAPDTGPLHVARALEVPVIGLFGHSNPWRVGPYRKYHDLWVDRYTNEEDTPDPMLTEPRQGRMERITVTDVLERVDRATERYLTLPTTLT